MKPASLSFWHKRTALLKGMLGATQSELTDIGFRSHS